MKNIFLAALFMVALSAITLETNAQKVAPSPKAILTQTVGLTDITVEYSRPGLKGRSMSQLAPNGKVWRTGANSATKITFANAVTIDGKEVAAGDYSIHSIPGDSEWTVIINSKQTWGNQYDETGDVLRVKATPAKLNQSVESFTINITDLDKNGKDAKLELSWGTTSVKVPFTVSK